MAEDKARAVGINYIAPEVGDVDKALDFYGGFLPSSPRGMGLDHLKKSDSAIAELARKNMRPCSGDRSPLKRVQENRKQGTRFKLLYRRTLTVSRPLSSGRRQTGSIPDRVRDRLLLRVR